MEAYADADVVPVPVGTVNPSPSAPYSPPPPAMLEEEETDPHVLFAFIALPIRSGSGLVRTVEEYSAKDA